MNFCVFLSTPVEIRAKYGYIGQREKVIFLQKEVRAKSKKKTFRLALSYDKVSYDGIKSIPRCNKKYDGSE